MVFFTLEKTQAMLSQMDENLATMYENQSSDDDRSLVDFGPVKDAGENETGEGKAGEPEAPENETGENESEASEDESDAPVEEGNDDEEANEARDIADEETGQRAMCARVLYHNEDSKIHARDFHPCNDEVEQRIPPHMTIYGFRAMFYDSEKDSPLGMTTYTYKRLAVYVLLGDDRFYRVNPTDTFENSTTEIIDNFPATKTK